MRVPLLLTCLAIIAPAAAPAADVFYAPQHQTVLREQDPFRGHIHTVYQDVRAPMIETQPGLGMTDDLQLGVRYTSQTAWLTGLEPEQRDQGTQQLVDVELRVRAASWLTFEVEGGGQAGDLADQVDFRNIDLRGVIGLYSGRYRGGSLVLGAAAPVSTNGNVPGYSHESDIKRWSYLAEFRFTESLGFNVFHLNLGGRWAPNVINTLPAGWIVDGQPLPAGETRNNTTQLVGRLGWSWRPFYLGRVGAEYVATLDRFEVSQTQHLANRRQVVQAFVELDPALEFALQGFIGANLDAWNDSRHNAIVAGGQVVFHL